MRLRALLYLSDGTGNLHLPGIHCVWTLLFSFEMNSSASGPMSEKRKTGGGTIMWDPQDQKGKPMTCGFDDGCSPASPIHCNSKLTNSNTPLSIYISIFLSIPPETPNTLQDLS